LTEEEFASTVTLDRARTICLFIMISLFYREKLEIVTA